MPDSKPRPRVAVLFVAVSMILFLASLTQDGFYLEGGDLTAWSSMGLLLTGWLGLLVGVPAWLANPALATAWILALLGPSRRWYAFAFAVLAVGLCASFLIYRDILVDEAGHRHAITAYAPGYWLWLASAGVALAGAFVGVANNPTPRDKPAGE
jgi:hypothetical protein